jgi:hypothetical protein
LLRIHGFAFAQVGAAAKILSGSRQDGAPHGNFRLDLFDDLGEADAQRRRPSCTSRSRSSALRTRNRESTRYASHSRC